MDPVSFIQKFINGSTLPEWGNNINVIVPFVTSEWTDEYWTDDLKNNKTITIISSCFSYNNNIVSSCKGGICFGYNGFNI